MINSLLYLMLGFAIFSLVLWIFFSWWVLRTSNDKSILDAIWRNENRLNQTGLTTKQALLWKAAVITRWLAVVCGLLVFVLQYVPQLIKG